MQFSPNLATGLQIAESPKKPKNFKKFKELRKNIGINHLLQSTNTRQSSGTSITQSMVIEAPFFGRVSEQILATTDSAVKARARRVGGSSGFSTFNGFKEQFSATFELGGHKLKNAFQKVSGGVGEYKNTVTTHIVSSVRLSERSAANFGRISKRPQNELKSSQASNTAQSQPRSRLIESIGNQTKVLVGRKQAEGRPASKSSAMAKLSQKSTEILRNRMSQLSGTQAMAVNAGSKVVKGIRRYQSHRTTKEKLSLSRAQNKYQASKEKIRENLRDRIKQGQPKIAQKGSILAQNLKNGNDKNQPKIGKFGKISLAVNNVRRRLHQNQRKESKNSALSPGKFTNPFQTTLLSQDPKLRNEGQRELRKTSKDPQSVSRTRQRPQISQKRPKRHTHAHLTKTAKKTENGHRIDLEWLKHRTGSPPGLHSGARRLRLQPLSPKMNHTLENPKGSKNPQKGQIRGQRGSRAHQTASKSSSTLLNPVVVKMANSYKHWLMQKNMRVRTLPDNISGSRKSSSVLKERQKTGSRQILDPARNTSPAAYQVSFRGAGQLQGGRKEALNTTNPSNSSNLAAGLISNNSPLLRKRAVQGSKALLKKRMVPLGEGGKYNMSYSGTLQGSSGRNYPRFSKVFSRKAEDCSVVEGGPGRGEVRKVRVVEEAGVGNGRARRYSGRTKNF